MVESYDLKKLKQLLQDFYNLTSIKICIYDREGNELCYYPEKYSSFCSLLRSDKFMNESCNKCDSYAFSQCKISRERYTYTCHAGLLECVSPIVYGEEIIGYMVLGQVKAREYSDFSQIEKSLPFNMRKALSVQYATLPAIDMNKINSAVRIMDACAGYEYLKKAVRNNSSKIDLKLKEYIDEHLIEDLSVSKLCSNFHLSHSEIYSIFKEYFSSTPAEFIKTRRLNKSCELLTNTDLPIYKIAERCGIPDYNYYSKLFKRAYNISPALYRKKTI